MITTLLPPEELSFLRSIARTAAVLITALCIDARYPGRAIADYEIADILEADPRTINKQLRSLSASSLMLEQREGKYVVTPLGRNTLFQYRHTSTFSIEETEKISEPPLLRAQNVLHEEEESISNHESESSSIIEGTNCAQILEATHLLFETAVTTRGITDRNPDWALAWISKAYADRHNPNFKSPQGLIYARLRDNVRPPVYLLKDPAKGLPDNYLIAIGRMQPKPEPASDDAEDCIVDEEPEPTPKWDELLRLIERTYPTSKFKAYALNHLKPVTLTSECWVIGVTTQDICEWMNSNAQSIFERLLVGIMAHEVRVQFVVR